MSECTDETGFQEHKRPRTSEFPPTSSSEKGMLRPVDLSETVPGVPDEIADAALNWEDDLQEDPS